MSRSSFRTSPGTLLRRRLPGALLAALTAFAAATGEAPAGSEPHPEVPQAAAVQGLVTEELRLPMAAAGSAGLEAVIVRPPGRGPFPLAVVSHGSPRAAADRPPMRARWLIPQMSTFARRGYLVAGVLRRGYGSSPGGWAEGYGACAAPDYAAAGRAGTADIAAAIAALVRRPDVDPTRIVAVGHSAGGFATVALTAQPPPGLVAAISFAGGRGSLASGSVCDADALVAAFRTFGTQSRVPMLWVYAENDRFFGPALAERFRDAFAAGGAHLSFVGAPAFGPDGHDLFSGAGRPVWTPLVEAFLRARGLPARVDVEPGPALGPPGALCPEARADFQRFLDGPPHKAFAVSARGAYGWRTGRDSPGAAAADALRTCETAGGAPCRLHAVNDVYAAPGAR